MLLFVFDRYFHGIFLSFKEEKLLEFYLKIGSYRAVNTLRLGYTNQSVNVV